MQEYDEYDGDGPIIPFDDDDYSPFMSKLGGATKKSKNSKSSKATWEASPGSDPECSLGVCTSDGDCGGDPEVQCGYTRSSRPPSDAKCGKDGQEPCQAYKCCMREFTDYDGSDAPDNSEAPSLCPFDTSLNCAEGCQVCDTPGGQPGQFTARCCLEGETCPYSSQCEIPCTASSQFQGEGVGCMFCPSKGGLMACTRDTAPCTFDNFCTANTRKKYRRPSDQNWNDPGGEDAPFVQLGAMANYAKDVHGGNKKGDKQQQMQLMVREQQMAFYQAQRQAQARFSMQRRGEFWCR
jgi:hypothetical protein